MKYITINIPLHQNKLILHLLIKYKTTFIKKPVIDLEGY